MAKRLHISTSELIRRMVTNTPLPEYGKQEAVLQLVKINGDMARLGNLLKLTLDHITSDNLKVSASKIHEIMASLQDTQTQLKQKIKEL